MATITSVFTMHHVADRLGEDLELLEEIVRNDDNLSYGNIVSVYTCGDEAITALTLEGIDELRQMLAHARSSAKEWDEFLDAFVDDNEIRARVKAKSLR